MTENLVVKCLFFCLLMFKTDRSLNVLRGTAYFLASVSIPINSILANSILLHGRGQFAFDFPAFQLLAVLHCCYCSQDR